MLTAVGPIPQQRRIVRYAHCCGPHSLAIEDTFSSKMPGDPFPTSGGDMLRMVGDPRHNYQIFSVS